MNTRELPTHWEACSRADLEQIADNGSYGQRFIARRYLSELDRPSLSPPKLKTCSALRAQDMEGRSL